MSGCCDDAGNNGNGTVAPTIPPVTWCDLKRNYSFVNGRVVPSGRQDAVADGIYVNPTITVQNGCIAAIQSGTSILYSECDPCAGGQPPPPTPTPIPIDGDGCNLAELTGNGLLVKLVTAPSSCFAFQGCGTPISPLQVLPIISPDAGNTLQCRANGLFVPTPTNAGGVNFTGCGIQITNGIVTALPLPFQPILDIQVDPSSSITVVRSPGNPCLVTIGGGGLGGGGLPNVTLTKGIRQYDTVGDLPADPSLAGFYWGAVGAANPRALWGFVDGIGWREIQDSTASSLQITI
jgi:hypothetical protein